MKGDLQERHRASANFFTSDEKYPPSPSNARSLKGRRNRAMRLKGEGKNAGGSGSQFKKVGQRVWYVKVRDTATSAIRISIASRLQFVG